MPGKHDLSGIKWRDPAIWLDIESKRIAGLFDPTGQQETGLRAFRIDFVGRQTVVPGRYGHLGGSEHLIIMDRLLSAERIDAEPWQKEIDAFEAEVGQER